jgi:SAM-dependent methyltransferase
MASLDAGKCARCGWASELRAGIPVWLSSADRVDPLFRNYLDNYDQIAEDDLAESIMDPRYAEAQAHKLFGYLGDVRGLRVCDLGVGRGLLFRHLVDAPLESLMAVDIALSYLVKLPLSGRVRAVVANAEALPFLAQFDLLVSSDVLEHVANVGDFLISANRSIVPGGRFVVRVPFEEDLLGYARRMGCPYRLVHLRSFTRRGLRRMLEGAGFAVERMYLDGFQLHRARAGWQGRLAGRVLRGIVRASVGSRHEGWLPNPLGRTLLRPMEIAVLARKVREIQVPEKTQCAS